MKAKEIIAAIMDRIPCVDRPGHNMLASEVVKKLEAGGYAIVPIRPNDEMIEDLARIGDGPEISGEECWGYMLAAAKANPEPANPQ